MIIRNLNVSPDWIDLGELGVRVHSRFTPETPEIEIQESSVASGRKKKMGYDYTHRNLEAQLFISDVDKNELRRKLNLLNSYLNGSFQLRFKTSDNIFYKDVSVTQSITTEEITLNAFILNLKMTAYNPFRYSLENSNLTFNSVIGDREHTIINEGNYKAKPIVKLSGYASQVNLEVNGNILTYVNLLPGEIAYIDNESYVIHKEINGQMSNALGNWRNSFIELEPGFNILKISGQNMNLTVEILYNDTFL